MLLIYKKGKLLANSLPFKILSLEKIVLLMSIRLKISTSGSSVRVEDFDRKLAETDSYLQLLLTQVTKDLVRVL